ncbi:cysteine synthase A [Chitinispirillales bacterium ANBcel5]|uniref:cysteine synthase A n=1 Tax=Cellulosispirillum alkaliphilum TaxID=3039283 RepID=UPI002A530EA8|nr:cysteine synthase A [Chitinispirillales bacterium ANBcel5]
MNIAHDITELIGHTPLVKINTAINSESNLILAKLEQQNPSSSVKDRAALGMIKDAEEKRLIGPGSTIIEATSGNTGIALAFIAASRGYNTIVVMPDSMSAERKKILTAFGARLELTAAHEGMQGSIKRAEQLASEIPHSFIVGQFDNSANVAIHEATTAEEILNDTDGTIDIFIAGVGTGGTITGVGRHLKRKKPQIKVIGVEPSASGVLNGAKPAPHMIQGIGAGFIPSILDMEDIDEVIGVSDSDAFDWTRKVIRQEGIAAGISSGAALFAANEYIEKNQLENKTAVVLFPDSMERYLSIPMLFADS